MLFSAFFILILRYLGNQNVEDLPRALQPIFYTSTPFAGGLITLCLFSLIGSLSNSPNLAVSRIARKLSEDPARSFFFGFLGTAYLVLIRPSLAAHVSYLPQVEWISVGITVYSLYAVARLSDEESYVSSDEHLGWKKHARIVTRETGHDLKRVTSAIEQFIELGTKEQLLIYLTLHLQRLGLPEESIFQTLTPLINYQEEPKKSRIALIFSFSQMKKKLAEKKKERENLLSTLFEKIQMV